MATSEPSTGLWPTPQAYAKGKPTNSTPGLTPLDIAVRGLYPSPASNQLTLFAAGSLVSLTPSQVAVAALPTSATSGRSSCESFAKYGPDGSWRKTCQGYSQVTLDGSLEECSGTWPRAGMTRNGTAYRRQPLALLTGGIASGSWPTPCAEDAKNVPYQKGDNGKRYPMFLGAVAPDRMWPTPRAEYDSGRHRGQPDTLHSAVKTWPTPTARDWKSGKGKTQVDRGRSPGSASLSEANGGSLNPDFVEWLMGYPRGWTVCAASGTRSSRRSPNGSRARSSRRKA